MTNCADRAGVCDRVSPHPQIARFRADAKICDSRRHCWGNPGIGVAESRQESMGRGVLESGGASPDVPFACCGEGLRRRRGPKIGPFRRPARVRVRESPRPQIARFRPNGEICGSPNSLPGNRRFSRRPGHRVFCGWGDSRTRAPAGQRNCSVFGPHFRQKKPSTTRDGDVGKRASGTK